MLDSRLLSVIMIANKNFRGTSAAEMPHIQFANHATRILQRLIVHSFVVRKRGAISGADNVRLGDKVKRCFLDAVKDRVGGGGESQLQTRSNESAAFIKELQVCFHVRCSD